MDEDRTRWPAIAAVTVGVLGGILILAFVYSVKGHEGSEAKLRDAKDIIAQCHETIKEIEAGLEALREPVST